MLSIKYENIRIRVSRLTVYNARESRFYLIKLDFAIAIDVVISTGSTYNSQFQNLAEQARQRH
jgi:hypothetical protein